VLRHLPQLLNYIFEQILHHRESEPGYVNHWTIICGGRHNSVFKQQIKYCTEITEAISILHYLVFMFIFKFSQKMPNSIPNTVAE